LIIAEALDAIGAHQHHVHHIQRTYVEHLRALFDGGHRAHALPGVQMLLEACRQRPQWTMGLLTGNVRTTARIKLSAASIDADQFKVCVWGDDGPSRNHLPHIAMQRCANKSPNETVIIGDTLHDIACARACGCKVIAVATGVCSAEQLACGQPDLLLDDLSDTSTVLAWLERMSA
jgi:phosphoglycolate phosphatase-like HAD superfamily hydrolase